MTTGVSRAVVLMAKRPAAGVTKTRLTSVLSPQQAADLYEQFLLDTIDALQYRDDCTTFIAIDDPASAPYFSAISPRIPQVHQRGSTLGERLDSSMTACLEQGFDRVFALGTDSPDLPASHLDEAFTALERSDIDVVLGPADDGGYYLIGWKQRWAPLVTDVVMSTPDVLADTTTIADQLGARVALISPWHDVDTPDDLERLRRSLAGANSRTARFLDGQ